MAVSTIKSGLKATIAYSDGTAASSLAAKSSMRITTNFVTTGRSGFVFIPIYAGNPKCVITNMWSADGRAHFTAFNPTDSTLSIDNSQARMGILYK